MVSVPNPRERVIAYGEVFTPPGLVNDMLDLVANECEREDSRFLEPACGDGNFLAEVLTRRLSKVTKKHRVQAQWEAHALLGLACLYGIELLQENAAACRGRLNLLFQDFYQENFKDKAEMAVIQAAWHITRTNIVQGDARMMTGADSGPIIMTEWSLVGRGRLKRRLFEYRELVPDQEDNQSLFAHSSDVRNEEGEAVFIARHVCDLPIVHYRDLGEEQG